jgi:hypothetical protein
MLQTVELFVLALVMFLLPNGPVDDVGGFGVTACQAAFASPPAFLGSIPPSTTAGPSRTFHQPRQQDHPLTATLAVSKNVDSDVTKYPPVPSTSTTTSSLQFVARTIFTSDPLVVPSMKYGGGDRATQQLLVDFFSNPDHRNYLLLGNGPSPKQQAAGGTSPSSNTTEKSSTSSTMVVPEVQSLQTPMDSDLWNRWMNEVKRFNGATPPNPLQDELVLVKSSAIPFPLGMSLYVNSIVGVQLILPDQTLATTTTLGQQQQPSPYPSYRFTLVKDTLSAKGPLALVWLFKKMTGNGNQDDQDKEQTTHSYSVLRVLDFEPEHHNNTTTTNGTGIVFQSESHIEINVRFPSLLLKFLPMSREQCNQQGSESVQASFESRGAPALQQFVQAYQLWSKEKGE